MADASPFREVQLLPMSFIYQVPKPSWYGTSGNTIIITTDYDDHNAGIYKYDITTNAYQSLTKYDVHGVQPKLHGQFIDYKHDMLYIFGGEDSFFTFNLNTKELKIGRQNDNYYEKLTECQTTSAAIHVSTTTTGDVHILFKEQHFKFDCNNSNLIL